MNRIVGSAFRTTIPTLKPQARLPIMNRARTGLYHGKHIMFGNHVAHSERKARRTWLPNLQRHVYKSEILGGKSLRLKLTTEAMRNIDRLGGFDNYILKTSDILLGGPRSVGVELKKQMKEAYDQQVEQNRLAAIQAEFRTRLETAIKVATEKAEKVERENALKLATGNI